VTHRQRFLRLPRLIQQQRTPLRSLQALPALPRPATRLRTILAVLRGLLEPLRLRTILAALRGLLEPLRLRTIRAVGLLTRLRLALRLRLPRVRPALLQRVTPLRTILVALRGLLERPPLATIRVVGLLRALQRPTPQLMGLARRLAEAQAIPRHSTRQGHLVAQVRQHLAVLIWCCPLLLDLLGITVVHL
jgi:hypothetical protein